MQCPTHHKELRQGNFGLYCPSKMEDGVTWCKYKVKQNQGGGNPAPAQPATSPKENRNWDKEAYEKCCSIWAASLYGNPNNVNSSLDPVKFIKEGWFWNTFQAIRADADKRFATGWDKAVKTFTPPATQSPADVVADQQRSVMPSDDYEAGKQGAG